MNPENNMEFEDRIESEVTVVSLKGQRLDAAGVPLTSYSRATSVL